MTCQAMLLLAAQYQQLNEPHLKPLTTHQPLLQRCTALQALLDDLVAAAVQRVCAAFDPIDLDSLVALHVLNVQTGAEMPELIRDAFLALVSASDQFSSSTHPPCSLQTALYRESLKDTQQVQQQQRPTSQGGAGPSHSHDLSLAALFKAVPALKFRARAEWLMQTQFEWLQSFHAMQLHVQDELAAVRRMLTALADGADAAVDWSHGLPRITVSADDAGLERGHMHGPGASAAGAGAGGDSPRGPFWEEHHARAAAQPAAQECAERSVVTGAAGDDVAETLREPAVAQLPHGAATNGCVVAEVPAGDAAARPANTAAGARAPGVGADAVAAERTLQGGGVPAEGGCGADPRPAAEAGDEAPMACGRGEGLPSGTVQRSAEVVRLEIAVRDNARCCIAVVVEPGESCAGAPVPADAPVEAAGDACDGAMGPGGAEAVGGECSKVGGDAAAAVVRGFVESAINGAVNGSAAGCCKGAPGREAVERPADETGGKAADVPDGPPPLTSLPEDVAVEAETFLPNGKHGAAVAPAAVGDDTLAGGGGGHAAANGSAAPSMRSMEPQGLFGSPRHAGGGRAVSLVQSDADAASSPRVSERSGGVLAGATQHAWAPRLAQSLSHHGSGAGLGVAGASSGDAGSSSGRRRAGSARSGSGLAAHAHGSIGSLVGRPQSVEDFLKQRERILHGVRCPALCAHACATCVHPPPPLPSRQPVCTDVYTRNTV